MGRPLLGAAVLLVVTLLAGRAAAEYRRTVKYDGQVLVRCSNVSGAEYERITAQPRLDVWAVHRDEGSVDIRTGRADMLLIKRLASGADCVVLKDVEELVREFERTMVTKKDATWFEEYHEYDEIVKWYEGLADTFKDLTTYVPSIGKSLEGRDMPAMHISAKKEPNMLRIYFQCQIHAREWISGAVCGYVASFLLENYGTNAEVTELLDSMEFIFVPFVNPDGYAYTWNGDRLWRKNRRPGSSCDGVDLNRNYNDHWGGGGSSDNPCSETFHGSGPESEPETQNTANYFKENPGIVGAIDWHSFSQLILRPYGWTNADAPDEARLKSIGDEMSSLIEKVHNKYYTSQKSIGLYPTTGTASDWFYTDDANGDNDGYRAAGYTIELRDTGLYGFQLPPDQIIPNGEEVVPAVLYFAKTLLEDPLKI